MKSLHPKDIFDNALLQAWKWLKAKTKGFCYSLTDWMQNPIVCLGCRNYEKAPTLQERLEFCSVIIDVNDWFVETSGAGCYVDGVWKGYVLVTYGLFWNSKQ